MKQLTKNDFMKTLINTLKYVYTNDIFARGKYHIIHRLVSSILYSHAKTPRFSHSHGCSSRGHKSAVQAYTKLITYVYPRMAYQHDETRRGKNVNRACAGISYHTRNKPFSASLRISKCTMSPYPGFFNVGFMRTRYSVDGCEG